eukprot:scaffold15039_cov227-Skeletonema_dohrnii-CCMP3373.AAC.1
MMMMRLRWRSLGESATPQSDDDERGLRWIDDDDDESMMIRLRWRSLGESATPQSDDDDEEERSLRWIDDDESPMQNAW